MTSYGNASANTSSYSTSYGWLLVAARPPYSAPIKSHLEAKDTSSTYSFSRLSDLPEVALCTCTDCVAVHGMNCPCPLEPPFYADEVNILLLVVVANVCCLPPSLAPLIADITVAVLFRSGYISLYYRFTGHFCTAEMFLLLLLWMGVRVFLGNRWRP